MSAFTALLSRDLALVLRRPGDVTVVLAFFVVAVTLFPLGIGPEDELAYVLEVTDNDAVTGPKSARTSEYTLRVPSVAEIFKKADEEANKAQRDMSAVRQEAEEVQKKVNEALAAVGVAPVEIPMQGAEAKQRSREDLWAEYRSLSLYDRPAFFAKHRSSMSTI